MAAGATTAQDDEPPPPPSPPDWPETPVPVATNGNDSSHESPGRLPFPHVSDPHPCLPPSLSLQGRGRWFEPSSAHNCLCSSGASCTSSLLVTRGPRPSPGVPLPGTPVRPHECRFSCAEKRCP